MFENAKSTNVPKILDLKSSSEQIFSENWRWVPEANSNTKFIAFCRSQVKQL